MAYSVPQRSKMRPVTISRSGNVIYSPVDDFWISLPRSIRVTVYNSGEQKILIMRVVPQVTFKELVCLVASEIFAVEPLAEFSLQYKSWTLSGNTVLSTVDLDQTVGAFHCVLDLQVVQVDLQGDDWTWYMSNRGFLQTRKQIQVLSAASSVQMCGSGYRMFNSRDSAIFTMLHHQFTTPAILRLAYTQRGHTLSTPVAQEAVKVTICTKEGRRLFTTVVIRETKFEEVAIKNCALKRHFEHFGTRNLMPTTFSLNERWLICGGLRVTNFTFKTISPPGPEFLFPDIMVGGFGPEVNIIAAEVGDEDRWFWRVCNAGYLEKRVERREAAAVSLFKAMLNPEHPLHDLVPAQRQSVTGRSLRNSHNITVPHARTKRLQQSFLHYTIRLYNNLP
ncbi:hypothetical protein Bbelb_150760 [Branchiostoma belcheri]|nr:hypothetical protein Bbelb_150760 [Branchiostoma belcheri]